MKNIGIQPSSIAQWQQLVTEAAQKVDYNLEECLEHYLVLTLQHHLTDAEFLSNPVALRYLSTLQTQERPRWDILRKVGDECLLLSGLFPQQAEKRLVPLSYFIEIGRRSYYRVSEIKTVSSLDVELFRKLSQHFVGLLDILHVLRSPPSSAAGDRAP